MLPDETRDHRIDFAATVLFQDSLEYAIRDRWGRDLSAEGLHDKQFEADWAEAFDILERISVRLNAWDTGNVD